MKDKELITNATQLLSELNKSFQSCKQGTADDIRTARAAKHYSDKSLKSGKVGQQYFNRPLRNSYQRTSLLIGLVA